MNQEELILITGATGFLGSQVVRELLQREPRARLALLIRPRKGQTPAQRAESIVSTADSSRVQVYDGDVSEPDCGLNTADRQQLRAEATRIIHCAATVRFDHSLEQARHMNVDGTRKMLDFAASMRSLKSFVYVGTAYVAGEREGLILEASSTSASAIAIPMNKPKPRPKRSCVRGRAHFPASFFVQASSWETPRPA